MTTATVRRFVFPAIMALTVLDVGTTLAALEAGGSELNPVTNLLIPTPALFVAVKVLVPVAAWVLWEHSSRPWWPIMPLVVLSLVVVWNAGQLYA